MIFRRIETIPREGAVKRENGVIAYREGTGHGHVIRNLNVAEVLDCGGNLYVRVGANDVAIEHPEHETLLLPTGDYQVTRRDEEGWRLMSVS